MTPITPTAAAQAAVAELRVALDWLAVTLVPGTHKPYRAPTMSAEARAARDRDAKLEWLERVGIAPGETPAPLDLDVADLLAEVMCAADDLADVVMGACDFPLPRPASSAFADPTPYLRLVDRLLPDAVLANPAVASVVEDRCDGLVFRTTTMLGLFGDGQVLDALCPWCGGRDDQHPTGGGKTLRVRAQLPAGKRSVMGVDPKDVRWYIVCEGGGCEPSTADCGTWLRGRPAWDLRTEAEWLSDRLERSAS